MFITKFLIIFLSIISFFAACFVIWRAKTPEEKFLQFSPKYGQRLIYGQCFAFVMPGSGCLLCVALHNPGRPAPMIFIASLNLVMFLIHGSLNAYTLYSLTDIFDGMKLHEVLSNPSAFPAVNQLQHNISCCGMNSSSNWFPLKYWINDTKLKSISYVIPPSCCVSGKDCIFFSNNLQSLNVNKVGCDSILKEYMSFALSMYTLLAGGLILLEIAIHLSFLFSRGQSPNSHPHSKSDTEKQPLLLEKLFFTLSLPGAIPEAGSDRSSKKSTKAGSTGSRGSNLAGNKGSVLSAGSLKKITSKQEKKKKSKYLQHGSLSEEGDPERDKRLSEFARLQQEADKAIGSFN
ncbi:hypothetical protein HELRODRAFT_182052 [Helobdella robusta]|uniref:Tetraspanin n=1 Tax=Helobdella robusta TaxID=6412 RepID=T1FHN6_HELRO|nr:hypothetical protein HELRODRAFT_182052 [Helobdella robusta]ESN91874.1 hypothetical protein HELRODRAFT_182052 [Helobdella robusta]